MKASLLALLLMGLGCTAFAQVKPQRLVAMGEYYDTVRNNGSTHSIAFLDSVRFRYSGSRHSEFDHNIMAYFLGAYGLKELAHHNEPFEPLVARINSIVVPNNIDSSEFALRVQFDSLHYYDCRSGKPVLTTIEGAEYLSDGRCVAAYAKYSYREKWTQFRYYYNRLVQSTHQLNKGGQPWIRSEINYAYDVDDNMVFQNTLQYIDQDTSLILKRPAFSFNSNRQYEYRVDYSHVDYHYRYNAAGQVVERFGGLYRNEQDSFFYTPGVPGFTKHIHHVYNYNYPDELVVYDFHINALGQKDTLTFYVGTTPREKTWIVYNAHGNPVMRSHDIYDSWGQYVFARDIAYYYYEDYDAALHTEQPGLAASAYRLYPNPAADYLNLEGDDIQTYSVYDLQGSCVISSRPYAANQRIDIRQLPSGMYVLRVYGKSTTQSMRFIRN